MSHLSVFAPAKINLLLAITGRRPDGFHNLVSLVVPLEFGDTLTLTPSPAGAGFSLRCADPAVPLDDSNLILKAAQLYSERSGLSLGGTFDLEKRIPMGAGLGGGSSDASAALLLLEQLSGGVLGMEVLEQVAARIGSDCPLFLRRRAIVMRGRGERVELLPEEAAARLSGRRVLLFKPEFGISTPWAYRQMAAGAPASYLPEEQAEALLAGWLADRRQPLERLLFNNMEGVAFRKYLALPALLAELRTTFDLEPRMSGSGSCCFSLLPDGLDMAPVRAMIRKAWGETAFIQETKTA